MFFPILSIPSILSIPCLQDVGLLPNVVRMADYMLVEGALDMLVTIIQNFKVGWAGLGPGPRVRL